MTHLTHTPGPWIPRRYKDHHGFSIYASGVDFGCIAERWETSPSPEREAEMRANGDLLSAAPQLLEALEELARQPECKNATYNGNPFMATAQNKARAALAKAKGQ